MICSSITNAGRNSGYGYLPLIRAFCLVQPVSQSSRDHLSDNKLTWTVGGFFNLLSAAWINWFNAILFATLLLLELLFMPETLYPRNRMLQSTSGSSTETGITAAAVADPEKAPYPTVSSFKFEIPRTKGLLFLNFHPLPGMRHPKPWDSVVRFLLTFRFPVVVIAVLGYSFLWYWWVLSVITMVPAAYASYTPLVQGLLFLGLFVGTLVSEICCSGRLSDWLVGLLARRNGNARVAEMRLWLAYPAILVTAGEFFSMKVARKKRSSS